MRSPAHSPPCRGARLGAQASPEPGWDVDKQEGGPALWGRPQPPNLRPPPWGWTLFHRLPDPGSCSDSMSPSVKLGALPPGS